MDFLVLLPIIPALWYLFRHSAADALISVYLPVYLLIPAYYGFKVPHLPGINASTAVLIPIGIAVLTKKIGQWKFTRTDLWLVIYTLGLAYTENNNTDLSTAGFDIVGILTGAALPYAIGKVMLEDERLRERFVRRFVSILALVAIISLYEWRMEKNLFELFYSHIFPQGGSPNMQMFRGGFARIQGPYAHAIHAGIIFGSGWIMSLWLSDLDKRTKGASERRFLGLRQSVILSWIMFGGLVMTGSRGPWIGAAIAFAVFRIGRAENVKRAAIITLLIGSVVGGIGYKYLDSYTAGSVYDAKDKDQENAIYRRVLLDAYKPIADAGGFFGWGNAAFPRVLGQESVDNQFLLLRLTQGWLGLSLFLMIAGETCVALLLSLRRLDEKTDVAFVFCLLAIILGELMTLTSVYMDFQPYQLFFFCMGWGLAIRPTHAYGTVHAQAPASRFAFARKFS